MELRIKAKNYAIQCHASTNHMYDGGIPYSVHLELTVQYAEKFIFLLPTFQLTEIAIAACWAHDVIEDCRQTYNDVKAVLGPEVADIVYAVTNEKGRNRAERENDKYFKGIRNCPGATFVKLCDRLANVYYNVNNGGTKLSMYQKEHDHFLFGLFDSDYQEMFDELKTLLQIPSIQV